MAEGNEEVKVELVPSLMSLANMPQELVGKALEVMAVEGITSELSKLLAIHRAPDGLIIFTRKVQEGDSVRWEQIGAFRADALANYLPGLAPYLIDDAYATVNSYYRTIPQLSANQFPTASRKETNLRYLNACYADIDCGRTDEPYDPTKPNRQLPPELCVAAVLKVAERGDIPYPSMLAYSGRGLYLFWLLRDQDNPTMPERSRSAAHVAFYKQVNRALHDRLNSAGLPVDRGAHDAARVLRVPGSVHSGVGKPVEYTGLLVSNTRNPSGTYTLADLAGLVGAKALVNMTAAIGYEAPKTGRNPNKRKGYRAVGIYQAADIEALFQHQGGWTHGTRRKRLTIFATMLKRAGKTKAEILESCTQLATNCNPPYPDQPAEDKTSPSVKDIVDAAWTAKGKRYRSDYLVNTFGVTAALVKELPELQSIVPSVVKALRKNAAHLAGRKMQREARRRFITHHLTKHPRASAREMFRELTRKGIKTNPQTVNEDMNALGHKRAPGSPGRPRKQPYPDKAINQ